jgi:hypothetical protein
MRPISHIMELTISFQQAELVETRQVAVSSTTNTSISSHRPTPQDQPVLQGQLTSSSSYHSTKTVSTIDVMGVRSIGNGANATVLRLCNKSAAVSQRLFVFIYISRKSVS